jgi:hypothetical protein
MKISNTKSPYEAPSLVAFGSLGSVTFAGAGTMVEVNPRAGRPMGACAGNGVANNAMRYPCS